VEDAVSVSVSFVLYRSAMIQTRTAAIDFADYFFILCLSIAFSGCAGTGTESAPPVASASHSGDHGRMEAVSPTTGGNPPVRDSGVPGPVVSSVEVDLTDGVTADETALLAVSGNPALSALRLRKGISRIEVIAAGLFPNPVFSGKVGGSVEGRGETIFEAGLGWEVTSLLRRSARRRAAELGSRRVDLEVAWEEWRTAVRSRRLFLRALYTEKVLQVERDEVELRKRNVEVRKRALNLGLSTDLALLEAERSYREARGRELGREGDLEAALLDLKAFLGLPGDFDLHLAAGETPEADLSSLARLSDPGALAEKAVRRRLDLRAFEKALEENDERKREAVLGRFPKLTIGPFVSREASEGDYVGAELSLELPLLDSGRVKVERAEAAGEKLLSEYRARISETKAEVFKAAASVKRNLSELRHYDEEILPVLKKTVQAAQAALQKGLVAEPAVLEAEGKLLAARRARIEKERDLFLSRLELEAACGMLFTRGDGGHGATRGRSFSGSD